VNEGVGFIIGDLRGEIKFMIDFANNGIDTATKAALKLSARAGQRCSNPDCPDDALKHACFYEPREKLKQCSSCHISCYCSSTCQKQHWRVHKKVCKIQEG
jgi:hypothetical protein